MVARMVEGPETIVFPFASFTVIHKFTLSKSPCKYLFWLQGLIDLQILLCHPAHLKNILF